MYMIFLRLHFKSNVTSHQLELLLNTFHIPCPYQVPVLSGDQGPRNTVLVHGAHPFTYLPNNRTLTLEGLRTVSVDQYMSFGVRICHGCVLEYTPSSASLTRAPTRLILWTPLE